MTQQGGHCLTGSYTMSVFIKGNGITLLTKCTPGQGEEEEEVEEKEAEEVGG